ncbi:MAG: N-acetylmuramoyl-L-alanine amidase, partial [Bacteroidota bacterium]
VPFNKQAWHAGRSNFRGIPQRLNDHAIGISMANRGILHKEVNRYWLKNDAGRRVGNYLNPNQVVLAQHQHGGRERYWEKYPQVQVAACHALCAALVKVYPTIMDVVGHDEVAIDRKIDPGPAFPRQLFYPLVPNRGAGERILYRVDSPDGLLNLRDRPNASGELVGVLQQDQLVFGRSFTYKSGRQTGWLSVSLDERHLHNGFVSSKFLRRVL